MKSVKRIFFAIVLITIISLYVLNNFVYADAISMTREIIIYSPLYYIAIIVVIAIVVGISIFILRKIYKSNQLQKDEESIKGDEK